MLKIRKLENNVLRLAWRKGKICLRYFKICALYFEIGLTYFFASQNGLKTCLKKTDKFRHELFKVECESGNLKI